MVHRLTVHLVLVTKYRRGPITDRVRELLVSTAQETCERLGANLLEADGETDHLHLLVEFPPRLSISVLVGALKTNTSRRVREQGWAEVQNTLWGDHFWSPSYFAESAGATTLENITSYIRNQREPSRAPGRPRTRRAG